MRAIVRLPHALLLVAATLVSSSCYAFGLPALMPRVQLSALFEGDRAGPNSSGARAAADAPASKSSPRPSRPAPEDASDPEPALAPEPPVSPLDPPRPRWKSMTPGMLK